MSTVDERRRKSVKERMKRWEEVAVASRPTPSRAPKPRPRTNRRAASVADMTTEKSRTLDGRILAADESMLQQNEVHQERQVKIADQALAKTNALLERKKLENTKEPERRSSTKSPVKSLSPLVDQSPMSPSKESPASSPFADRKVPSKPLPYSEHKKLESPGMIRKAATVDTIPPNSCSKGDAVSSRPRLPTPRLDTMTPQPYKARSSSLSSSESSTQSTRRPGSVSSPVHTTTTPLQEDPRIQRQATPEVFPKPQSRPKPAVRPKSAMPFQKPAGHSYIRPVSHSGLHIPIDMPHTSSEIVPSSAKTPPVPAPRFLAEKSAAGRNVDPLCAPPNCISNMEPGEETTRPDGPPMIKSRTRPKPAVKPKGMALPMHDKPNSLQNERQPRKISKQQRTERMNQKPIQIQPENELVSENVEGEASCKVPEVSLTGNLTGHHNPAISDLYCPPVMSERSAILDEPTQELQEIGEKQPSTQSITEDRPRVAITDPDASRFAVQPIYAAPSKPKRKPPAEHVSDERGSSLQTGSTAASPLGVKRLPLSQSRQSPPEQQKTSPTVDPPASPVRSSPGKRRPVPPPPPTRLSSIEKTVQGSALSGQEEVPVTMLSELVLPHSEESSQGDSVAVATNPVQPDPTVTSPTQSKSGRPPSRPPPKPPRSIASHSIKRLPAMAQCKPFQPPEAAAYSVGHHVLIHQAEPLTSQTSVFSDECFEDSDGWGSEFDSDSPEEEEGPLRPKVYHIAREIVTTEQTFVRGLRLLHEDFRQAVSDASGKPVIGDELMSRILQNTEQLLQFNSGMLAQLQERIENWDSCAKIGDIMKKNAPFLKLYTPYIQNFDGAIKALDEAIKKADIFEKLIQDFERSPKCNNLPISAYMLETVQRIPRYKLLLQDYIRHLPVDSDDRRDATEALAIVSSVAAHVNEGFKKKDNFQRVLDIQRKLTGKGSGDIVKPGREFLKQGRLMKVCRKDLQPRVLFLFSDTLLYTHEVPAGQYGLDAILPLTGMRVAELLATQYKHAFTIVSTRKSFQLLAENEEERDDWIRSLKNAIRENQIKHRSFDPQLHGWAQAVADAAERGTPSAAIDFKLGEMAPVWISDDSVSMCMGCMVHFTVTRRRHHCRSCGKVLCGKCSSLTHHLNYLKKIARVCSNCYDTLDEGVGKELAISPPKKEPEVVLRHEEQEDVTDSKAKMKRRKSKIRQSKKKLVTAKLPAILTEVQARDANAQMSGYLDLRQGRRWKRRWFVAHNMILYTYKRHEDIAATATMPLLGYRLCKVEKRDGIDKKEAEFALKLDHPGTEGCILKTDTEIEFKKWWYVLELAVIGERPPAQEDELELQKSPDREITSPLNGSPGSEFDVASPKPLSPVDMGTVTANSIGYSESGMYCYAVTPLKPLASPAATRGPKSDRTPPSQSHVYEEIKQDQEGQFRAVAHHSNPLEDTIMDVHQDVLTTGAVFGNGVIEKEVVLPTTSDTIEEQYDVRGNPLYEANKDNHDSARQSTIVSQSIVESEEYEIQGNPLYQHQSGALHQCGQEYNFVSSPGQFHESTDEK